jgi:uncharacterized protein (TIGR02145 family)
MSATVSIRPNTFEEVVIGTQTWMKRNYDFGGSYPDNDIYNISDYGKVYTWAEAMAIDYPGWHLPTNAEYITLVTYLGGENGASYSLRETGTTHWTAPNTGATNSSGFTARPLSPAYANLSALFWTSTEIDVSNARSFWIEANSAFVSTNSTSLKATSKLAVRLIKD